MTRILVFGRNGQLARALAACGGSAGVEIERAGSSEFNLRYHFTDIIDFIGEKTCHAVINAAAWTDVDAAESGAAEQAWILNALAPAHMARACANKQIPFIHVSTESVFDGRKATPYRPDDPPCPANFYGVSKLEGERAVQSSGAHAAIVRTSWVFADEGKNFISAILAAARKKPQLNVVNDQTGIPTYAPDLARALLALCQNMLDKPQTNQTDILHFTSAGPPVSRFDYARNILKLAGVSTQVLPISSARYGAPAPRPSNAVLGNGKLDSSALRAMLSARPQDWRETLARITTVMGD